MAGGLPAVCLVWLGRYGRVPQHALRWWWLVNDASWSYATRLDSVALAAVLSVAWH